MGFSVGAISPSPPSTFPASILVVHLERQDQKWEKEKIKMSHKDGTSSGDVAYLLMKIITRQ